MFWKYLGWNWSVRTQSRGVGRRRFTLLNVGTSEVKSYRERKRYSSRYRCADEPEQRRTAIKKCKMACSVKIILYRIVEMFALKVCQCLEQNISVSFVQEMKCYRNCICSHRNKLSNRSIDRGGNEWILLWFPSPPVPHLSMAIKNAWACRSK